MTISKLGTPQLKKAIEEGKFEGDQLELAKAALAKREAKAEKIIDTIEGEDHGSILPTKKKAKAAKKAPAKKAAVKKVKAVKPVKEKKAKAEKIAKVKKEKTIEDYEKGGVSGLVRKMLSENITANGKLKVAGCTYGQANKAVQKKFERKLYSSEFDRNFLVLKKLGIVDEKLPPHYKPVTA